MYRQGQPRANVAATKPAASVRAPPPSAKSVSFLPIRSARQSRSTSDTVLARSPVGSSWTSDETVAERELGVGAVDSSHDRLRHERHGTGPGDELAQPFERTDLDVNARGGEDHVVDVARSRVCDLVVERLPQLVSAPKLRLVLRERSVAAADTRPGGLDVDLEQDDERLAEHLSHLRRLDRSGADGDDAGRPIHSAPRSAAAS